MNANLQQAIEHVLAQRVGVGVLITGVRRLLPSRNGNPTWEVTTSAGSTFLTARDSQVGYVLDHTWEGEEARLWTDEKGYIIDARRLDRDSK